MRPARVTPRDLWADDRGLSVFLASLLAIVFALPPLVPPDTLGRFLTDAVFSVMLVSGTTAVAERRWVLVLVTVVTLAAVSLRWVSWILPAPGLDAWSGAYGLAALVLLCVVVLRLALRCGPVTRRRIQGAIAVYVLFGVTWAQAYALVTLGHPGAFAGAVGDSTVADGRTIAS